MYTCIEIAVTAPSCDPPLPPRVPELRNTLMSVDRRGAGLVRPLGTCACACLVRHICLCRLLATYGVAIAATHHSRRSLGSCSEAQTPRALSAGPDRRVWVGKHITRVGASSQAGGSAGYARVRVWQSCLASTPAELLPPVVEYKPGVRGGPARQMTI